MPPARKKNVSVILFDVNTNSHEKSLQAFLKICLNKQFEQSKDLTRLILVNSDTTENALAVGTTDEFQHINEVSKDVTRYNPGLFLELLEESGTADGNFLEAMFVGLYNLREGFQGIGGIITYQLLFITDARQKHSPKPALIKKIIKLIKELNAFVYLVGPDIEPPSSTISTVDELEAWMDELEVGDSNLNLVDFKEVMENTEHSIVCNYALGWELFLSYQNPKGSQPWNVPLQLGEKVKLDLQSMKILEEAQTIRLKAKRGHKEIKWIDAEDETIEFPAWEVISGLRYHEKFIEVPDRKLFQLPTNRSFKILCITPASRIPEYMLRGGGCYCAHPRTPSPIITALITTLAQEHKYIIARKVYNAGHNPKLVALVPKPHLNCFHVVTIPYADSAQVTVLETDVHQAPKHETAPDLTQFLDELTAQRPMSLGVQMKRSIMGQRIVNYGGEKLLKRTLNLGELDEDYMVEVPAGEALRRAWVEREAQISQPTVDDDSDQDFDW